MRGGNKEREKVVSGRGEVEKKRYTQKKILRNRKIKERGKETEEEREKEG